MEFSGELSGEFSMNFLMSRIKFEIGCFKMNKIKSLGKYFFQLGDISVKLLLCWAFNIYVPIGNLMMWESEKKNKLAKKKYVTVIYLFNK